MSSNQKRKTLSFNTLREEFTECIFSDGVICRTKQPLVNLELKKETNGKDNIGFSFGNPVTFIADFEEGVSGKYDSPKVEESDVLSIMEFKTVKIPLNVYEVPEINKILFTKTKFSRIRKTKLFDTKGHRIYDIQSVQDVGIFDGPPI